MAICVKGKEEIVTTRRLTFSALLAAMIFIFTFTFKIPVGGAIGYAHLGDMFIILAVWVLGRKSAPIAAGLGAALADFAAGFAIWVLPTFIIKFGMALIIGLIAEKIFNEKLAGYIAGTIAAAVFHIAGYLVAWYAIAGAGAVATAAIPLIMQTLIGLVLGNAVIIILHKSKMGGKLKVMARGE